MKRALSLILALVLCLSLCACQKKQKPLSQFNFDFSIDYSGNRSIVDGEDYPIVRTEFTVTAVPDNYLGEVYASSIKVYVELYGSWNFSDGSSEKWITLYKNDDGSFSTRSQRVSKTSLVPNSTGLISDSDIDIQLYDIEGYYIEN